MDSFAHHHQSAGFPDEAEDPEFSAILSIHIHHARNIHNICIYDNQDVYAKFSLTNNPDETFSTSIVKGGGKNPEFDERLSVKVNQPDSVLKCEMWMLSRARNYMEDQLLGFALVPLAEISRKGNVTADYSLSSTDLFHSPAGTVRLSLSLDPTSLPIDPLPVTSSISSEVVLLDRRISEVDLDPVEYSRIEFPDINVAAENQQMATEYFTLSSRNNPNGIASFLHLGSSPINPHQLFEYDMTEHSSEDNSVSPENSVHNSGFLSSTTTSLSNDRNSSDSTVTKCIIIGTQESSTLPNPEPMQSSMLQSCPDTPTSNKANNSAGAEKGLSNPNEGEVSNPNKEGDSCPPANNNNSFGQVFSANLEAEQSAMQQHIVGMYMRSMQQFTESLSKMKLPMDLNKLEQEEKLEAEQTKKDGSRVFYGSRAFF